MDRIDSDHAARRMRRRGVCGTACARAHAAHYLTDPIFQGLYGSNSTVRRPLGTAKVVQ
ncbi:MAG: hypothetical protein WDN24_10665 [Sphingomonas sp.]